MIKFYIKVYDKNCNLIELIENIDKDVDKKWVLSALKEVIEHYLTDIINKDYTINISME